MTNDEKRQHLTNIASEISQIEAEVEATTYDEFINEEQMKESVYTHLQMIGQAAHQLSLATKKEELTFDPKVLSNFRNARYNQEAEINHANVWQIITNDLTPLKDTINREAEKLSTP
jgi:uncharacterized protein with HEPN domain